MADLNPSDSFWDLFLEPAALDDLAIFNPTGSDNGTTPSKPQTDTTLNESTIPDTPNFADTIDPRGVQFDVSLAGDYSPALFENYPDILQDKDFWNKIGSGPSLADVENNSPAARLVGFSCGLGSKDPWPPIQILDDLIYTDTQTEFEAYQLPQPAMPPPPVPLAMNPVHASYQPQGPAPVAMMYQPPSISDWIAAQQPVQQEPRVAVIPTLRGQKRKGADYDNSDAESTNVPGDKRRKLTISAKAIPHRTAASDQALHIRTEIIETFDGSQVYDSLPHPPINWSIYRYTTHGELEPGTLYSPSRIKDYLYNHPLHTLSDGSKSPKKGNLRLWIQRNPPDSKRRYPNLSLSNRCRFENCFATHNVINQGHLRLCFDELWHLNNKDFHTDPFHNAGYVHLNCLERHLDFPQLCHDLPIMVDKRHLPLEPGSRNRMRISPCHIASKRLQKIASTFLDQCENQTLVGYPTGARPHEGSLVWRLMQVKVQARTNLRRLGTIKPSHGLVHLGDLEVEFATRNLTRKPEYQSFKQKGEPGTKSGRPKGKSRKRVVDSDDDDESD